MRDLHHSKPTAQSIHELFERDELPPFPVPLRLPEVPTQKLLLRRNATANELNENRKFFLLDLDSWTLVNHGMCGATTGYALQVANAWREASERQPCMFYDRQLLPWLVQSIKHLANFVHVTDAEEFVMVSNATSGVHAVIESVVTHAHTKKNGSKVPKMLCFSTRYEPVSKMLRALESQGRVCVVEQQITLQESLRDDLILQRLEEALAHFTSERIECALVIVDHVTSYTGVLLPVEQIVERCHAQGIPVLIDGAHGLLNLDLNLDAIGADFYVGNCHKWFASPKGAAFLHASKKSPVQVRPQVVSHGYFEGFQSAFIFTGLQDYSAWLSIAKCTEFWEFQDATATRQYMHQLAQDATELLYERWKMPKELEEARKFPTEKRNAMRLVKIPSGAFGIPEGRLATLDDSIRAQDILYHRHRIEVPVRSVDGQLFVRISAHVYNGLADYERLARAVVEES